MKKSNKIISFLVCFCLLCTLTLAGFSVNAEVVRGGDITISTVSALPGDRVIVSLDIRNNPGIMAMTFSITYDSSALTYEKFYRGYLLDYTVADHPDQNLIRFVNCESFNKFQNKTIASLQFKVKDNAAPGPHPISIRYSEGDFCNWRLDRIMPNITPGGVEVGITEKNCPHKEYGKWATVAEAGCNQAGAKQRICSTCGHVDIQEIPQTGHVYEKEWVIDTQATASSPGSMSRHCMYCGKKIDILSFTEEQAKNLGTENEPGLSPADSSFTEQLMQNQHPEGSEEPPASEPSDDPAPSAPPSDKNPEILPDETQTSLLELLSFLLTESPGFSLVLLFAAFSLFHMVALF